MHKRLILDVTKTFQTEFATGIQRVIRELIRRRDAIGRQLGMDVLVVVASAGGYHRLDNDDIHRLLHPAKARTSSVLVQSNMDKLLKRLLRLNLSLYAAIQRLAVGRQMARLTQRLDPVDIGPDDVIVLADNIGAGSTSVVAINKARPKASATIAVVYDIISLLHPDMVPPTTIYPFRWGFDRTVPGIDGIITIARSTADEIRDQPLVRRHRVPVTSFHLGHDLRADGAAAATTIPEDAWSGGPTFAMVGTIEPRKRHEAVLTVFSRLWEEGCRANLLMIGSIGWDVDGFLDQVRRHPEYGRSLFLCHQVGDHELRASIQRADATIMASKAEGFGLPVVESLALGTPVLASDIPVFREIAGDAGCYFPPNDIDRTTDVIRAFIRSPEAYRNAARTFRWIDWDGAADQFAQAIRQILATSKRP